jgi:uncharacterized membrane protein (UPF0136 family)
MAIGLCDTLTDRPQPAPARLHLWNLALWTALVLPLAGGVAVASMQVQQRGFAPAGVLSILIGLLLGGLLAWAARLTGMGHRPSGLIAALAVALLTVAGQHAIAYRAYREDSVTFAQSNPQLELVRATNPDFGPAGCREFFLAAARGGQGWFWLLDAALIIATTLLVLDFQFRQPYCDRCRSWYRTIRRGPLTPARAAALAAETDIDLPAGPLTFGYRLLACRSGCGPAAFGLSWRSGGAPRGRSRRWLNPRERHAVLALLEADCREVDLSKVT